MASELVKLEREKRKSRREDRMMNFITDPQMMGLITLLGGLYAAQRIPFSDNKAVNENLCAVATGGVVLAAVCRAGLGGWPALAAAGVTAATTKEGIGQLDPLANLLGAKSIWSRVLGT